MAGEFGYIDDCEIAGRVMDGCAGYMDVVKVLSGMADPLYLEQFVLAVMARTFIVENKGV